MRKKLDVPDLCDLSDVLYRSVRGVENSAYNLSLFLGSRSSRIFVVNLCALVDLEN